MTGITVETTPPAGDTQIPVRDEQKQTTGRHVAPWCDLSSKTVICVYVFENQALIVYRF